VTHFLMAYLYVNGTAANLKFRTQIYYGEY